MASRCLSSEEMFNRVGAQILAHEIGVLKAVLDLLAAQRDLARARFTDIQTRADLLQSAAALVFAAGE